MAATFGATESLEVVRPIINRALLRSYDIREFGAVSGGGSGDAAANTLAIQTVVHTIWIAGGGRIFIPPGEFWVSSSTNTAAYPGAISLGIFHGANQAGILYTWYDDYTYSTKHIILSVGGDLFKSAQDGNLNHDPDTDDGTWWTPVTGPDVPYGTLTIVIEGCGIYSVLKGNFDGFILDRCDHNGAPAHIVIKNLSVVNTNTGSGAGCIRLMGVDGAEVSNCLIQGHIGVQAGGNFDGLILPDNTGDASAEPTASTSFTTTIRNNTIVGIGADASVAGSCGIIMGMHTEAYQNSIVANQHGIRGYGVGCAIHGNRMEKNDVAIYLGMDATGVPATAQGYHVFGNATEGNRDAFHLGVCNSSVFSANIHTDGSRALIGIDNRSQLRISSGGNLVFMGCVFGTMSPGAGKASLWIDGNLGGKVTFISCETAGYLDEQVSGASFHAIRAIQSVGFGVGPLGRFLTYAQLPDWANWWPNPGEHYLINDGALAGGGTAVAGSTVEGGGSQALEVVWTSIGTNAATAVYKCVCVLA